MPGTPVVIVGTPEYKISERARALAGRRNGFVVSYTEWAAAFGYGGARPGDASKTVARTGLQRTTRNEIRSRLAALQGWNGQCFYVGHSHGAATLFIGGYTKFTRNPNYQQDVSGADYAQFLADVLPKSPTNTLHLPVFACWLGDPKESNAMGFQRDLLNGLRSRRSSVERVYAYATKFETWYGAAEFVSVNGIRRGGFSGEETQKLLQALREKWKNDPESMRGKFNQYVDDEFRVAADSGSRAKDDHTAEFTRLEDILSKDYLSAKHAAEGTQKRVFTTFFLRDGRLARDKRNEVGFGGSGEVEYV